MIIKEKVSEQETSITMQEIIERVDAEVIKQANKRYSDLKNIVDIDDGFLKDLKDAINIMEKIESW